MTAALAILLAGCAHTPRAELQKYAAHVAFYGAKYDVDPKIAASVMVRESTCRRNARSLRGALGLMQIKRGCTTRGCQALSDAELMEPRRNIRLGVRRMSLAARRCGGGPPLAWLGAYDGLRGCRASAYGARVIATMEGRP